MTEPQQPEYIITEEQLKGIYDLIFHEDEVTAIRIFNTIRSRPAPTALEKITEDNWDPDIHGYCGDSGKPLCIKCFHCGKQVSTYHSNLVFRATATCPECIESGKDVDPQHDATIRNQTLDEMFPPKHKDKFQWRS